MSINQTVVSSSSNGLLSADLDQIQASPIDEDPIAAMKSEINVWIDVLVRGQTFEDPVFEGMVRDFISLNQSLTTVLKGVEKFMHGVDGLCDGLVELSESLVTSIGKSSHRSIASDCCKFRESTSQISRSDAPHSIIAKLKRDLQFNVTGPLSAHILHNKKLRTQLENRRRRLQEYMNARKVIQSMKDKKDIQPTSQRYLQAEANMETAKIAFDDVDRPVFEWLLMLEEYKGDIYDSLLQTLKYLQYEFFAGSAHCVSRVLPTRMEFRPLLEMTPEQLEPQVEMELNEECHSPSQDDQRHTNGDATSKILQRWERGDDMVLLQPVILKASEPSCPVDPLSLSVLVSQGFDEAQARRALRFHENNSQLALECLLEYHDHNNISAVGTAEDPDIVQEVRESVRIPLTLKWVQKLKKHRQLQRHRKQQDKRDDGNMNGEKAGITKTISEKNGFIENKDKDHSSNHRYSASSSGSPSESESSSERRRRRKERRKKKVVREKRKREKKEQSHSADVTSSNPLDLSESVDILETSSHETFVENPLSLIDRRSSISSLTESEFSSSCHYRHRRKSSTDTSPIAYDVSKPTADFGDLLLLEDIPSNQSLNPSLPQTIKPFNTSLCKFSKNYDPQPEPKAAEASLLDL